MFPTLLRNKKSSKIGKLRLLWQFFNQNGNLKAGAPQESRSAHLHFDFN